jgi:DNA-directed RNA polymerase subunit RPC12/RpoP
MTAFTCAKCYRRFTPTAEAIQAALAAGQGQKHTQIICPHCGKGNKVAPERLRQAVRFSAMPATPVAESSPATPAAESSPATPVAESSPATPAAESSPASDGIL